MDKKAVIIGVKNLCVSVITAEDTTSTTYGEIETVPGTIEIAMTPNVSSEVLGADDIATYEQLATLDSLGVTVNLAAIGNELAAKLLGHTYGSNGVLTAAASDTAPYVAIGFEGTKSDGTGRKMWLLRGMFQESDETYHTKEQGTVNWQTPNLTATFGPRLSDGKIYQRVDSDDTAAATAYASFLESVPT